MNRPRQDTAPSQPSDNLPTGASKGELAFQEAPLTPHRPLPVESPLVDEATDTKNIDIDTKNQLDVDEHSDAVKKDDSAVPSGPTVQIGDDPQNATLIH